MTRAESIEYRPGGSTNDASVCQRRFPSPYMRRRSPGEKTSPVSLTFEISVSASFPKRLLPTTAAPVREVELFRVGEWLIAEDEHGVLVHPLANLTERLAIIDPAKVDRADLGDELRVKLLKFQRHHSMK